MLRGQRARRHTPATPGPLPTNQQLLKFQLPLLKPTYTFKGGCLAKVNVSGSIQAQERWWTVGKDVKLPSPHVHLPLFRDLDVYGFPYNNTQFVGGGGTVSSGWGNWKWQQVEHNVGRQKPHNHHSGATVSKHTHREQAEATPGTPISPPISQICFFNPELKSFTVMKQTTAPVHKIQPCWLCQDALSNVKTAELTFLLSFPHNFMTLWLLFLTVMWAFLRYL